MGTTRLRDCGTRRKVVGSIADGVIGIFHWHNPSGRIVALGSTQLLRDISSKGKCKVIPLQQLKQQEKKSILFQQNLTKIPNNK